MAAIYMCLIFQFGCLLTCHCLLNPVTTAATSDAVFNLINQLQSQVNTLQTQVNSQQNFILSQSSDIKDCTGNLTNLNARTTILEQTIQTLETKSNPVAFFVRLSKTITNHHQSSILVFDDVLLNTRNGYDKNVGIFVAPQRGIYRFELVVSGNFNNVHVNIIRNGQLQLTVIADHYKDGLFGAGSGSVVLHLEQGDKIWNQFADTGNQEINGGTVTAFSGFMIDDM